MAKRDKLASAPQYDSRNEPTIFTLKVIHGGKMTEGLNRNYIGGIVDYFDFVDGDKFGLIELNDFANQLGYDENKIRFWHQFGINLYTGGRILDFDAAVYGLVNYIPKNREIVIYFQHLETVEGGEFVAADDYLDMSFLDDVYGVSNSELDDSDDDDALVDSEYDMDEDDRLYDKYVDHAVEFNPIPSDVDKKRNKYVSEEVYDRLEGDIRGEVNSSDEFDSIQGSDEEDMPKYPKFNPRTESRKPEVTIGLVFSSKKEAKEAISTYCIKRGMNFKYTRNDKKRLQASCSKEGCGWYIWVSPMQNDKSWQVKVFNAEHTSCGWSYKNPSIRSTWVGRHFMKKFKNNPKLGTNEFRTEVCTKLKANISKQQAYRAKKKALELIEGTLKEQFSRIRDYCAELLRSNPGSSVVLKLTESDGEGSEPQFQRLYICFEACKQGFKACRKVIGVDGCFLKGHQGGQLLTAVGVDPNNNMFPIAYAIVESETRDVWEWFLTLLDNDIGFEDQYAWTFMSDKQKGLIPAFENLFPDADNRFCVQHLHSNMKKDGFLGLAIKKALWAASRATRIEEFKTRMQEMKDLDEKAYDWLVKKAPSQWSRAYFSPFPKCDILTNNMCESFNSLILPARDKPIITLLETVKNILMTRLQVNRDDAKKWSSDICPRIRLILEKNKKLAAECIPMKSDDVHFQIMGAFDQHCVDISQKSCSCRRWDLTGIPCKHAISAIWCRDEDPEFYVHQHYKVETYKRAYAHPILGITGSDLWPNCGLPPPLPPKYEKKAGRPKKLRRRGPTEPPTSESNPTRLKRSQRSVKCRKCGVIGHNKRTCPKVTSTTFVDPSEMNPEAPIEHVEPEEIHNGASQPFSVENTPVEATPPPQKKQKLPVRRSTHGSSEAHAVSCPSANLFMGSHETVMENSTCSKQSKADHGKVKNKGANIVQSSRVNSPIIVKGGVNYITMSNLSAYIGGGSSSKGTSKDKNASVGNDKRETSGSAK